MKNTSGLIKSTIYCINEMLIYKYKIKVKAAKYRSRIYIPHQNESNRNNKI